jgi:prepilin peptidase CpaA
VIEYAVLLIFPALMIFGGFFDMFTLTIPNRVSLVLVGSFFVAAVVTGMPASVVGMHVATGFCVLVVTFGLFAGGYFGGGDAKLLAVAALWIGFPDIAWYLVYVGLAGGLLALCILFYRMTIPPPFLMRQPWAMRLHEKTSGIPYGLALAAAALVIFPNSQWFLGVAG